MVTAGKVFRLAEAVSLPDVAVKLKGFRTEEEYEEGDYKFTLVTEIMNLTPSANNVTGVYPTTTFSMFSTGEKLCHCQEP